MTIQPSHRCSLDPLLLESRGLSTTKHSFVLPAEFCARPPSQIVSDGVATTGSGIRLYDSDGADAAGLVTHDAHETDLAAVLPVEGFS